MLRWLILTLAVACGTATSEVYKGYELLSVTPRMVSEVEFLVQYFETEGEIDVWTPVGVNLTGVIMVPPTMLQVVKSWFNEHKLEWSRVSNDLDGMAAKSYQDVANDTNFETLGQAASCRYPFSHNVFYTLSQLEDKMACLQTTYPMRVKMGNIGRTYEGRRIKYLKISTDATKGHNSKQSIMIEGGIHAREWISPASILYFIDKMLQDHRDGNAPGYNMLEKYDWYVVLVANPDGYAYTHESSYRYWRKNRAPQSNCRSHRGADANRNFGYYFRVRGCGDTYSGPSAFSEYESRALRDFFFRELSSIKSYVSIHSFAQSILVPWFWSNGNTRPPNYEALEKAARKMYTSMHQASGYYFRYTSVYNVFNYVATGASVDYALSSKPGLIALSIELRPDNRRSGWAFSPPTSDIALSGKEIYGAFQGLYNYFGQ